MLKICKKTLVLGDQYLKAMFLQFKKNTGLVKINCNFLLDKALNKHA